MQTEFNKKVEPTENQYNPYLARHGQRGNDMREYKKLLNDPRRAHHSDHGQTLTRSAGE